MPSCSSSAQAETAPLRSRPVLVFRLRYICMMGILSTSCLRHQTSVARCLAVPSACIVARIVGIPGRFLPTDVVIWRQSKSDEMERQMSQARITERPRGPDLSGLKIDARQRRDSGRRRWPRAFAVGLGAVLMVSAAVVFILGDKTPVVEVATVRADQGGRSALLNASGYVTPRRRATIAAKITGRVNEIFVEEGMHVQPGQVLATLDDADARARLASAGADRDATAAALGDLRVNLANAERELWRMEALRARELVASRTAIRRAWPWTACARGSRWPARR